MMDKTFEPSAVEARIAVLWDEADAFRAGRADRAGAAPYCIVIPPPNVTGTLHIGHALNNTLQDVLCRFERMRGKDVLWQPGTDHAGIATQMVVERQLKEAQGPDRRAMGREAFVERVWQWKAKSGGAIVDQLKRLGASCDWSRERFTMDEGLSKAVIKVFVELHRQGLIYRDKRLVNWDPRFQTAISDLEVLQVETKGHLWHIAYDIDGSDERIVVATTRPETMLGDTAIAVHPENERLRHLIGRTAIVPLVNRPIPVVADEYADPEKGTGAVKITPAHDFNDFEVGRRHGLPLINIFDAEARLALASLREDALEQADPGLWAVDGLDRFEARKRIVAMIEEAGRLVLIEPHTHMVPHGDRSNVVIEPYLTDQWYVNVKPLAEKALAAVRSGRTRIIPETWQKTYFQWLENIEPWCVSRQLWWGHQIPAWYGPDGKVFVAESEVEALAEALAHYVETGALGQDDAYAMASDPDRARAYLTRDEDVLDTWFSSALWPFSTLGWPDKTPELARFYPTSTLVTAFDIIFFWVARMMMMGIHFMDEVPFRDVYIHALVRDEKGAKMSKSKGNVIDPLELIDRYGADAVRFTLAAMAAQGRDIKLSAQRIEGYRNFATKIWNAARFAEMNGCHRVAGFDPSTVKGTLNLWIIGEARQAVADIEHALESFRFNDAAGTAYRFTWNTFCDWYLELAKPILQGADDDVKEETRASVAYVFDLVCQILHPFMPFLTEELWAIKGVEGPARDTLLCLSSWPNIPQLDAAKAQADVNWLVSLVTEVRSARSETNVPAGAQIPLVLVGASEATRSRVVQWQETIRRLARLSEVTFADAVPADAIQIVVNSDVAALPLAGIIDIPAERARLAKEAARAQADIAKLTAKLGNADFMARAPEEIVEEQRERLADAQALLQKLEDAAARLR